MAADIVTQAGISNRGVLVPRPVQRDGVLTIVHPARPAGSQLHCPFCAGDKAEQRALQAAFRAWSKPLRSCLGRLATTSRTRCRRTRAVATNSERKLQ